MMPVRCIICACLVLVPEDTWDHDDPSMRVMCQRHADFVKEHRHELMVAGVAFGGYTVKRSVKESHA